MKYEIKTKKLPKSEVEIEASLSSELLEEARKKALKNFGLSMELPGFRKGHIPEKVVLENIGERNLLEEAAEILINEHFPKIALQEKLDILGKPQISLTKAAFGNPLEFKALFTVFPEFKLPDYKKIAKEENSKKDDPVDVTEKEIEDVLLQIRKNKAHFDWHEANPEHKEHDPVRHGSAEGVPGGHPDLDKEENLPTLDDEFAQKAGNFKNLAELKTKVEENIKKEKEIRNIEKKRASILENILKNTEIEIPEILVEAEINKSLAQMKDEVLRMGGKFEDYLSHIKKTEEDMRAELRESSEKKAKIQLILNKIAVEEKIEPNKEILENEVKEILKHYPDSKEENARIYVSSILVNQGVLKLLENQ